MSNTNVDLTVGINLQIGSVPVALNATVNSEADQTTYTFDGCVQDAVINIGDFMSYIGQQFGLDVQLPQELNLQAGIDYIAGQIIYTVPKAGDKTTELGVAAKFDLEYTSGGTTESVTLTFYADTIINSGTSDRTYVVGAAIETDLKFANLPLIGSIPILNQYTLKHLGFSYTNADPSDGEPVSFNIPKVDIAANPLYTRSDPDAKNSKSYSLDTTDKGTTFNLSQKGFAFTAGLMKEGSEDAEHNFELPMSLPPAASTDAPAKFNPSPTSTPATPVHWININKTFGPVDLQKIGLNYANGEATFGLSAGFSLGAFAMDLQGLSITFPLPLPGMPAGNSVSFDLEGMGMNFEKGGLTIGGAFLKSVQNNITNYYGEVMVQAGQFGFRALGGYAPAQGSNPSSFFLYANINGPLGGPPFLYVTGIAFGFGINRTLILPTIDTLPGYLLLPHNAPEEESSPAETIASVMPQMAAIFQNAPGQYWVAAGIQFTSFEMVQAFALLTVSFGVETQIGILGTASVTLPKGAATPLAYIEIDLVASFTPSSGLLAIAGVISPSSYVWGGFVKLSGGFAFYTWFSGDNSGDFVVTIGGYHPSYNKPPQYPAVPRMTMSFGLGPFQASGTAYLALTPAMFMAGMQFTATWSAGPISAWFSSGVDFLVTWAPFTYRADAYVNVGCSVDLGLFTVHAHIGANLQVWGPSFGGQAEVDLDVCSFTISFGSSQSEPAPISWQNLEQHFLPPPVTKKLPENSKLKLLGAADPTTTANVTASVGVGLQSTDAVSQDGEHWDWIIDPNQFMITTALKIPANQANWMNGPTAMSAIPNNFSQYSLAPENTATLPGLALAPGMQSLPSGQMWEPTLHVKPMDVSNAQCIHNVQLCKRANGDAVGVFSEYLTTVAISPMRDGSASALWSDPSQQLSPNSGTVISNTLLGFSIMPLQRNPDTVNNVPLIQLIYTQGNVVNFSFTAQQPDSRYTAQSTIDSSENLNISLSGASTQLFINSGYVLSSLINPWVQTQRNSVLNDLVANGFSTHPPAQVNLQAMGTTEALTDWPMVGLLGQTIQS